MALGVIQHTGAEGLGLLHEQSLLQIQILPILCGGVQNEVGTGRDGLGHLQGRSVNEGAVIKAIKQILADLEFLDELLSLWSKSTRRTMAARSSP